MTSWAGEADSLICIFMKLSKHIFTESYFSTENNIKTIKHVEDENLKSNNRT